MRTLALTPLVLFMGVLLAAAPALAQSLTLTGLNGQTASLSAADIAALPQVQVSFDIHGHTSVYQGPLLMDVLAKVGAPSGEALRGADLSDAVLVGSADGYRVAFGLGEVDPSLRPERVILADLADGKPLDAKDGPFRIVVEGDKAPKRSARLVTSLTLIRLAAPKP